MKQNLLLIGLLCGAIFVISLNIFFANNNYPRSNISTFSFEKHEAENAFTQTTKYLLEQEKSGKSIQIACAKNDSWYTFVGMEYYGFPDTLIWSIDPNTPVDPTAQIVLGCNETQMQKLGYTKSLEAGYGGITIYTK
jgi:hypothetical protein